MAIQIKRAYDKTAKSDGFRVLVDRIWPRGVKKQDVKIDLWLKEISPSTALRQWFGHEPEKWNEFRKRYFQELDSHPQEIQLLREKMRSGPVTLVFGAKEARFNNASAIQEYLQAHQ